MRNGTGHPKQTAHRRLPHGLKTRQRLLEAAGRVFSDVGYRDATIQNICEVARANVAAVSYHFASKQKLYLAVWESIHEALRRPGLERLRAISNPEERLRQTIRDRMAEEFDNGLGCRLRRLIHREMGDPTESHAEIRRRFIVPTLDSMAETMAGLLGIAPASPAARYCAFSLQSQLVMLSIFRQKPDPAPIRRLMGAGTPTRQKIDALTDHLIQFTLGGAEAIRQSMNPAREARP